MPLAPRHGTASWEALFGRLVLWAVLCVCRADDEVPLQFRPSARCNASCSRGPAPPCSESPAALPFCSHLPVQRLLGGPCTRLRLHTALHRDQLACQLACEFSALLSRFDCLGGYSAKWDCHTCAVVYREWTCAMLVPVYPVPSATPSRQRPTQGGSPEHRQPPDDDGEPADDLVPLRPCREFCHRVEEQCPYFHPTTREQYAGEPVFICIDPNIPDLPSISNSSYGPPGNCYRPCHVNASLGPSDQCPAATLSTALLGPSPVPMGAANSAGRAGGRTSAPPGGPVLVVTAVWWLVLAIRTRGRHRLS